MKRICFRWICAVAVVAIVGTPGCGLWGGKSDYEKSQEARPLEVPPELDQPNSSSALTIPEQQAGEQEPDPGQP